MSFSRTAKGRALRSLARTKEKAQRLEFTLRLQGQEDQAGEVDSQTHELAKQIDQLIKEAMTEWLGNAAKIEAELRANNDKLQRSIRNIQRNVQTANNIAKAISYIDDAVSIAGRLLSPM